MIHANKRILIHAGEWVTLKKFAHFASVFCFKKKFGGKISSRQCHFIICLDRYIYETCHLPAELDKTDNQHYEWGFNVDFSKDKKYKNFERTGNAFQSVWCCHRIYTYCAQINILIEKWNHYCVLCLLHSSLKVRLISEAAD